MSYSKEIDCQCSLAYKDPSLNLRPQKPRTVFTFEQLKKLECIFQETNYPGQEKRQSLAEQLSLPDERIRVWFQNRRAKEKRLREEKLALSLNKQRRKSLSDVHYAQSGLQPIDIPAFFARFTDSEKLFSPNQSLHSQPSQPWQFTQLPPFWPPVPLTSQRASDAECSCEAELSPRSEEKLVLKLLKKAREKEKGKVIKKLTTRSQHRSSQQTRR